MSHRRAPSPSFPSGLFSTLFACDARNLVKLQVEFRFFQSASRKLSFCQIDSCRLGGVNEVLAVILLAAKFGIPVCPHAGGVGLCEYVQHLSIFDYTCVSSSPEGRILEYVDHLHEHFLDPVVMRNGHYMPPTAPGYSIEMKREALDRYAYPHGEAWAIKQRRVSNPHKARSTGIKRNVGDC